MFFLQTNSSEAKRLTIRDRGFAMSWMEAIYSEVLMCVRGIDVQVSAGLAISQVDPRVVEGHFFGWPLCCKFDGGMVTVDVSVKILWDGSPWSHMTKMSSIYLNHTWGILSWVCRNSRSSFPMNRLAYDGAIRVPMALPWTCKQFVSLKTNEFFVSTTVRKTRSLLMKRIIYKCMALPWEHVWRHHMPTCLWGSWNKCSCRPRTGYLEYGGGTCI